MRCDGGTGIGCLRVDNGNMRVGLGRLRMTTFLPVTIRPTGGNRETCSARCYARRISDTGSGADLASAACGSAGGSEAEHVALCPKVVNARRATRAVRYIDMQFTPLVKMPADTYEIHQRIG